MRRLPSFANGNHYSITSKTRKLSVIVAIFVFFMIFATLNGDFEGMDCTLHDGKRTEKFTVVMAKRPWSPPCPLSCAVSVAVSEKVERSRNKKHELRHTSL